jgi:hypothetical protein
MESIICEYKGWPFAVTSWRVWYLRKALQLVAPLLSDISLPHLQEHNVQVQTETKSASVDFISLLFKDVSFPMTFSTR